MGRPSDWWVLDLDGDPTPGAPDRLDMMADRLLDFADVAHRAHRSVTALQGDGSVLTWIGLSGDAFREQFGEFPEQVRKLYESHQMAGDALHAFAPKLEAAQAQADRALADGREARDRLATASGNLNIVEGDFRAISQQVDTLENPADHHKPDPEQVRQAVRNAQAAEQRLVTARGEVASAEQALAAAKTLAGQARQLRDTAARECVREIREASDVGIQPRSFWDKLGEEFAGLWEVICEVAKWVALVAGVIALVIGGPLAWVALAAGAVLLVKAIVDFAEGNGSVMDLVFGILGVIPGVKGLTSLSRLTELYRAGGLREIGKAALSSMKGLAADMLAGLRNLGAGVTTIVKGGLDTIMKKLNDLPIFTSKPTRDLPACGDPVDVATGRMFLTQTDVELSGALPLLLTRTHRSDYRAGRLFGPSWASTLDQRIELEDGRAHFVAADGMLLTYPVPDPATSGSVLAEHGAALPLCRASDGGFVIADARAGCTLRFAPPEAGSALLAEVTDRAGNQFEIVRDVLGVPVEVRHTGGYRVAIDTSDGLVTALRLLPSAPGAGWGEAPAMLREFRYDTDRRLTESVNHSGQALRFQYDQDGRLARWEDRNGMWYRYTYDLDGRCVLAEGRDGYLNYQFEYDRDNLITRATNSLGHTTTFHFNEQLQVVAETDPLGNTTRSQWDERHRLLSRTDPLGRVTRYEYDAYGNPTLLVRPDGSSQQTEYDQRGLPVRVTEFDGGQRWLEYDDAGVLVRMIDQSGSTFHYEYHGAGPGSAGTDWIGGETVRRDAAGLATAVTDAAGAVTRFQRDMFGRPVAVTDPLGGVTRFVWNIEGQLVSRTASDGATQRFDYDGEGNRTRHVDPLGRTSTVEYAAFDLPVAQTDATGARTSYGYDTELRLTSVTNPRGRVWRFEYDAAGRLVRQCDFDGRQLRFGYDAAGQLVESINGVGEVTTYRYDEVGNLIERRTANTVTRFGYDAADRLIRAVSAGAELTIVRDKTGRVVAETCNGASVTRQYDRRGRLIAQGTPAGAQSLWTYDSVGNPVLLRSAGHTLAFEHDLAGRETSRRLDDDITLGQRFDGENRLTAQTLTAGAADTERTIEYDRCGDIVATRDQWLGARQFTLDPLGRVRTVDGPSGAERYDYDAAGNLALAIWPSTAGQVSHNAMGERELIGNRLVHAGDVSYRYDGQNRLVARRAGDGDSGGSGGEGGTRYGWDAEDRLVAVVTPDGTRWRYRYDPLGRRIAKQRLAGETGTVVEQFDFTWSGQFLVEQVHTREDGGRRVTTWDRHPADDRPVTQVERDENGVRRFCAVLSDQLGTVTGLVTDLVDAGGVAIWHSRSTLWGLDLDGDGDPVEATPLRFPGQYVDQETGLHYNYLRYYDPETGRYLSPDPLGLLAAPNPMTYVANPQRWCDPLGLAPCNIPAPSDVSKLVAAGKHWYMNIKFLDRGALIGKSDTPEAVATNDAVTQTRQLLNTITTAPDGGHFSVRGGPYPNTRHDPLVFPVRADGSNGGLAPYNGRNGFGNTIANLPDGGAAVAAELAKFGRGEINFSDLTTQAGKEFAAVAYFAESGRGYWGEVVNLSDSLADISRMNPADAAQQWRNIKDWFTPAEKGDREWVPDVDG